MLVNHRLGKSEFTGKKRELFVKIQVCASNHQSPRAASRGIEALLRTLSMLLLQSVIGTPGKPGR